MVPAPHIRLLRNTISITSIVFLVIPFVAFIARSHPLFGHLSMHLALSTSPADFEKSERLNGYAADERKKWMSNYRPHLLPRHLESVMRADGIMWTTTSRIHR